MHGNGKTLLAQHLVSCVSTDILLDFEGYIIYLIVTYIHTYIVNLSELLCLIPILVGSSVATVCPPERDTALRTAVTTVTRVPL